MTEDALANLPLWIELLAASKAVSGGDFGHFPRLKAAVETVEKALSVARKEPEPAPKPINLSTMRCPNLGQMCSTPRTCTDLGECRITHPAYSQNHVIGELNALSPLCKQPPCPTPGICLNRRACVGEIVAADAKSGELVEVPGGPQPDVLCGNWATACPTPSLCMKNGRCQSPDGPKPMMGRLAQRAGYPVPDPQASAIKAIVVHILAKESYDTASLDRHPLRHLAPDWKR